MVGIYIGTAVVILLLVVLLIIVVRWVVKTKKQQKKHNEHRLMLLNIIESGGQNVTDNNGNTPLIIAVRYGFMDVFEKALSSGSDLNATDDNGNTAAHFAAALNNTDVLEKLSARGASLQLQSKLAITPLMIAIKAHTYAAVEFLVEKQHGFHQVNNEGLNVLQLAQKEWLNTERRKKDSKKKRQLQDRIIAIVQDRTDTKVN